KFKAPEYSSSALNHLTKTTTNFISRILFTPEELIVIYLAEALLHQSYLPTHKHQASSFRAFTYLAFQHARFTPNFLLPRNCVGSYPTFSPLHRKISAVIFCSTFC